MICFNFNLNSLVIVEFAVFKNIFKDGLKKKVNYVAGIQTFVNIYGNFKSILENRFLHIEINVGVFQLILQRKYALSTAYALTKK